MTDAHTLNGLHSCKPGNEPVIGQIKTFTIEHRPARNGKKAWIKIKSSGEKFGGTPYRIVSTEPTGYTDDYGNISFNLEIEPVNGGIPKAEQEADAEKMFPSKPEGAADGIMEAKKHLMQSARLYNLCVDAARTVVEDHAKQFWPDGLGGEMFRTCVSSLFIEATRAGMLEKMK